MKILLIGGGTGGHILPLRNLADELIKKKAIVELIVADNKLDHEIVNKNFSDLSVHFFKTGKIRRYFSWQNFMDLFKIIKSIWTAKKILKKIKPDVLFFKGGFVGFPFLIAAKYLINFKGKIYAHESDISHGLMIKITKKIANKTFENFSEKNPMPLFYSPKIENIFPSPLPHHKSIKTQSYKRKNILIIGGSQGAEFINNLVLQCHDMLLKKYTITLICGINKTINLQNNHFKQFEFLAVKKLAQKIKENDLIISRGGANSIFEIISAKKPSIIIPLPSVARNHQFLNAQYFAEKNLCVLLEQNKKTQFKLMATIEKILSNKELKQNLIKSNIKNKASEIAEILVRQN